MINFRIGAVMRFIHTSDIRLFASPEEEYEWGEIKKKDIEESFDRLLRECDERDVDLLLIAGNLFNAPPTVDDMEYIDKKLSTLVKTRTVIIPGNLDYIRAGSAASVYRFESRTVLLPADKTTNAYLRGINTCVTGFGYGRESYTENIISKIDPGRQDAVNILLGVGGDKYHMPFKPETVARKGFDYIALGGRSKAAHLLKNRLAYSGCPEPVYADETGRRGFILGEIDDNGTRIKWIPSNKRSYIDLSITLTPELTNEEVSQKLEDMVMKLGNENIYTIIFKGFASEGFAPDLKRIKERFMIRNIEDLTISEKDEQKLREENEANLIGSFISDIKNSYTINENIRNKALRYGLEALIMSGEGK